MSSFSHFSLGYCGLENLSQVNTGLESANRIEFNINDLAAASDGTPLVFNQVVGDMCLDPSQRTLESFSLSAELPSLENNANPVNYDLFLDGQSLQKIKLVEDDKAALMLIAEQFEAIFLQQMLKNMRAASIALADEDNPLTSQSDSMYQDIMDSQLALNMSQSQGIGIAEMLVHQLSKS